MNDKEKTPLKAEKIKDKFVYLRMESSLLEKIDSISAKKDLKNRSHAVRSILLWAFENGVENA